METEGRFRSIARKVLPVVLAVGLGRECVKNEIYKGVLNDMDEELAQVNQVNDVLQQELIVSRWRLQVLTNDMTRILEVIRLDWIEDVKKDCTIPLSSFTAPDIFVSTEGNVGGLTLTVQNLNKNQTLCVISATGVFRIDDAAGDNYMECRVYRGIQIGRVAVAMICSDHNRNNDGSKGPNNEDRDEEGDKDESIPEENDILKNQNVPHDKLPWPVENIII
ncbi:MAG: hypothetical protein UR28_C0029G0044 [Candidatus Peregrinibacteria bacterium GW2011_GWF2_33_10]|nr:MAG: hypothetical protein UR28_C0029G0044 [Candidatus Peregrinibacteria bacterium GW2011_GWF2_33_10]OGJ45410.1 MAG: hypothetical protein A2263_04040 [Candidatus Peregrinibacteria bacterium RIFOXYA2_FULL_33_21]OGJ45531.1 MAG: hypothetical protein A2272_00960 [Candidatus Peregrinibacteria bacterium RIFOXYA12_FULL_33_12]OGJ51013.1 MAG: hypothetical protein A2307_05635 [Candidatus Peregrinibacteria bacterium RIFOXYB2_FULL_33_20]